MTLTHRDLAAMQDEENPIRRAGTNDLNATLRRIREEFGPLPNTYQATIGTDTHDPEEHEEPCIHPPPALRAWFGRDDSQPTGAALVVVCTQCRTVLSGGARIIEGKDQ